MKNTAMLMVVLSALASAGSGAEARTRSDQACGWGRHLCTAGLERWCCQDGIWCNVRPGYCGRSHHKHLLMSPMPRR